MTEHFKWCPMLQKVQQNMLRQTLHIQVANDTQKSQSSNWPKWCCALWCYIISRLSSDKTSFQILWQTGCPYVNSWRTSCVCCFRDSRSCLLAISSSCLIVLACSSCTDLHLDSASTASCSWPYTRHICIKKCIKKKRSAQRQQI